MTIEINEKVITLQTRHTTYQMAIGKLGNLLHLYYGAKIPTESTRDLLFDAESHFAPYPPENTNRTGSLDILPQEFPTVGTGDMRSVALDIENADGTHVVDLRVTEVATNAGKYQLDTLPTFFANVSENVETLKVTLLDHVSNIQAELFYGVFADKDVITRAVTLTNLGTQSVKIHRIQSLTLDVPFGAYDVIHFEGRWAHERQFERIPLQHATTQFGSNYGVSGNRQNPGFLLASPETTEEFGACYGFNLVYSGNFTATAEKSALDMSRVTLGLGDAQLSWELAPATSFEAPEAILSYSSQGFGQLSQNFHQIIRENLCKSKHVKMARPVLINNWEATYFDFTGEKLIEIAQSAKAIGADLLVMDDGWFGARRDDNRALGDWFVNEEKLGMTLSALTERVNALGLKFGIWFEPEMVSIESKLYQEHPDWALNFPNRQPLLGRNQLNLDMSKPEVVDYLYARISAILDSAHISYVKWDMNRPITDWYAANGATGELQHRYVLGVYELMSRLTTRYADILWEGCSSGGARFDLGMLAFQPQIWTSDNNDAIDRLGIQYGTSFLYPVSTMGAHVAATPAHQNGRTTPFQTRAHVAMAGTYGYELDITKMTAAELTEAAAFTAAYKKYQPLIFEGNQYRLQFSSALAAWQFVSQDLTETLVTLVATDVKGNPPFTYLKLRGLAPQKIYELDGRSFSGARLMNAGLKLPQAKGDFPSIQLYLKEKKNDNL
ncbi:MAG: alpha-galactosidase [Streptococcaceae bacterium]|nr:alpha-galactosidase [Streptococcaceae bacterium]